MQFSHVLRSAFIFSRITLESGRFMNVPITSVLLWILQVFQYHEFWRAFSLVLNFPWLLHWRSDICVCEYCKAFWSLETEEWHLFLPVLQSLLVSGDLTLNTVFFWSPIHSTHCKKRTHIWKTDYGWKLWNLRRDVKVLMADYDMRFSQFHVVFLGVQWLLAWIEILGVNTRW